MTRSTQGARRNRDGTKAPAPPRPQVLEVLVVVLWMRFPHHKGGQRVLEQDLGATSWGRGCGNGVRGSEGWEAEEGEHNGQKQLLLEFGWL